MILLTWIISVSMVFPQMAEKACMGFKDITDLTIHSIFALAYVLAMSLFLAGMSVKIYVTWWCKQTSIQPTALREIEERKKKKKVTMCVLAVVVTYIIFYIPHIAFYMKSVYGGVYTAVYGVFTSFCLSMNSALNPYLFSFQNPNMRTMLKKAIFMKDRPEPLPS